MRLFSILFCALFLLVACGARGQLTLPPKPALDDHSSKPAEGSR